MITINGTYDQHRELIHWANNHNEKILEFIQELKPGINLEEKYPIIIMPVKISEWMVFNCHLPWVREFYLNHYNINKIPYGELLPK